MHTAQEIRSNVTIHYEYIQRFQIAQGREKENLSRLLLAVQGPYVRKLAMQMKLRFGIDFEEAVQEGNIGVLEGYTNWKSSYNAEGFQPLAYLSDYIRKGILKLVRFHSIVKIPHKYFNWKVRHDAFQLKEEARVRSGQEFKHVVVRTENLTPVSTGGQRELEGDLTYSEVACVVDELVQQFTSREYEIWSRRFEQDQNFSEIGVQVGLTTQRVQQIVEDLKSTVQSKLKSQYKITSKELFESV